MSESAARALVLFFFLCFLDDEQTMMVARRAADSLKVGGGLQDHSDPRFIHTTWKYFQKYKVSKRPKAHQGVLPLPPYLNFDQEAFVQWQQYWFKASDEELASLIWTHVLGIDQNIVAESLGMTPGSLRYRVGEGLAQLGGV